ncbi:MAG: DNA recombination protein RmuC [Oscillospiraceae bacterium]|jgi:DNA recombination protein RmuC|nr:DNA recombination protein RmuC [Oscillospiraceae bacterium]
MTLQIMTLVLALTAAGGAALSFLAVRSLTARLGSPSAEREAADKLRGQVAALEKAMHVQMQTLREDLAAGFAMSRREQGEQQFQSRAEQREALRMLQQSNEQKLEQMRHTVDERLQTTLNARLAESFKSVSEHLESVQRGLGEMKTLAADVGGLKKALTNVKIKGTFGEVQLERILEQMLHPGQYEKNAATKRDSADRVEFALRLPGQEDGRCVYLPIDSKFPTEDYERLLTGYELGDKEQIEIGRKALADRLRKCARDIAAKYLDPPDTTDFAILFLPTEGLYAEVVQNTALFESLQREFRVTVTGPTTLSAFLNALQMGFKTLAIEKRSVEVWRVLGAVKTEFETFAAALESAQSKLRAADKELDKLVGTRTNVMARKLREVERLPAEEAAGLLE